MRALFPVFVVASLGLAGCAGQGPSDDPIGRNLTWFSYLSGEDVRAKCLAGGSDRYRLVYNAIYAEQVRSYDLISDGVGGNLSMEIRVSGAANLSGFYPGDPFGPWRGVLASARLGPADRAQLDAALAASGFDEPAKKGKFLRSDSYYWIASACRAGRFHFNAWSAPSAEFDRIEFFDILLRHDTSGIPGNPVRQLYLGPFRPYGYDGGSAETVNFQVQIGENGLNLGPRWR